ncbi:MAG: hypothetical protein HYZ53_30020 [Planctomycetes bacterium]|nr:hypothetical protein [Planctomycetota bacterium]
MSKRLETALDLGYQRLCSFEAPGGGFSWYGESPANVQLTAYGIAQLWEMNRVRPIDLGIVERASRWLASLQKDDGSWREAKQPRSLAIQGGGAAMTAFVAWALAESGQTGAAVDRARCFLLGAVGDADDPYLLGLAANALLARDPGDPAGLKLVERLSASAHDENGATSWNRRGPTLCWGGGPAGDVEVTAIAAQALRRAPAEVARLSRALTWLLRRKDGFGGWYTTQATIQAIKALGVNAERTKFPERATVRIMANGAPAGTLEVTPDNSDLMQQVDLSEHSRPGENRIELSVAGKTTMTYQAVARCYLSREAKQRPQAEAETEAALGLEVGYDKTSVAFGEVVQCSVRLTYRRPEPAFMVIVDLGIPPGFEPDRASLADLRTKGTVDKYSIDGGRILLYLGEVGRGRPVALTIDLRATLPCRSQARESVAYEYYNPTSRATSPPVSLEVR